MKWGIKPASVCSKSSRVKGLPKSISFYPLNLAFAKPPPPHLSREAESIYQGWIMDELVIKNGKVFDPSQGIQGRRDIAIAKGKITAVASDLSATTAQRTIDGQGKIVTPGLIDIHAHVSDGLIPIAASPDDCGVFSGVTTVCDAGSLGWANFAGM